MGEYSNCVMRFTRGFTASAFDLLHTGHVLMLEEARLNCDELIVGLHVDPSIERKNKNKPIQSVYERFMQLRACKFVDQIIPYETELDLHLILTTQPINIRFIGEEYRGQEFSGLKICEDRNIEIFFNSRNHNFSSSELRARILFRAAGDK